MSQITFPIIYADDTNTVIIRTELQKMEHNLNIEIPQLSLWLKANEHSLHIKKACTMTLSNLPSVRNRINNINVTRHAKTRLL